jgi:hypothetical protein
MNIDPSAVAYLANNSRPPTPQTPRGTSNETAARTTPSSVSSHHHRTRASGGKVDR